MSAAPKARGLYDPRWEHDACGIGAVVNISGLRDHAVVEHGKQVLLNLMHRGAAGADESTGDGAGILLQVPHEFFAAEADRLGLPLPSLGGYGVAMLFLPQDPAVRRQCEEVLDRGGGEGRAAGVGLAGRAGGEPLPGPVGPRRRAHGPPDVRRRRRPGRRGIGAAALPGPQARRAPRGRAVGAGGRGLLRPLDVVPHDLLQGDVSGPAAFRLLPRPGRPADQDRPGHRPPARTAPTPFPVGAWRSRSA